MLHRRLFEWISRAAPPALHELPEMLNALPPALAANEFAFTTADRRTWHVRVALEALDLLEGERMKGLDAIEIALQRHLYELQFAALRLIGKGQVEDDLVSLTATDVRPPVGHPA